MCSGTEEIAAAFVGTLTVEDAAHAALEQLATSLHANHGLIVWTNTDGELIAFRQQHDGTPSAALPAIEAVGPTGMAHVERLIAEGKAVSLRAADAPDLCVLLPNTPSAWLWGRPLLVGRKVRGFVVACFGEERTGHPADDATLHEVVRFATIALMKGSRFDRVAQERTRLEQLRQVLLEAQSSLMREKQRIESLAIDLETANKELEGANAALLHAAKLKSQFLANMSHELRTPLNAIIGFSRIVMRKTASVIPEKQLGNLRMVHESGLHLLALINDLLDIERIEAGMLRVSRSDVDVRDLLTDIVAKLGPMAAEKGIDIGLNVSAAPPFLQTDTMRLRQILDNLVTNAIKYSDSGRVTVSARLDPPIAPRFVRLSVQDEGIGIPADQVGAIFEAFRQLDGSATRSQGGVGLGLHLVHRLTGLLGGTVEVESEVGRGSTFTLVLPAGVVLPGPKPSSLPPTREGRGPVVLVIDDQPQALEILQTELIDGGFTVHTATSGAEGLAMARELSPDVILLDIIMPGMDGWAVLEAIRKSPKLCATPVIVTSMLSDTPLAHDLGVLAWLTKPVSMADLFTSFRLGGVGPDSSVLIVEDDPPTRELLVQQFATFEGSIRTAPGYQTAMVELEGSLPQILVLDLMLPDGDGLALLERLRQMAGGNDVSVVVYTAKDLKEDERATLSERLAEVVIKASPQGLESVTEKVRRLMRSNARGGTS